MKDTTQFQTPTSITLIEFQILLDQKFIDTADHVHPTLVVSEPALRQQSKSFRLTIVVLNVEADVHI